MFLEVSILSDFAYWAVKEIKRTRFENREFKIYDATAVTTPQILHI